MTKPNLAIGLGSIVTLDPQERGWAFRIWISGSR